MKREIGSFVHWFAGKFSIFSLIPIVTLVLIGVGFKMASTVDIEWPVKYYYPVKLLHVNCPMGASPAYNEEVFKMTSSAGMRRILYVEKSSRREVKLPDSCVIKTVEEYPEVINKEGSTMLPVQEEYKIKVE